ncbi:hypothetical protein ES705_20924 [subsurface metagenome]
MLTTFLQRVMETALIDLIQIAINEYFSQLLLIF